jgi:hypothetical protein
MKFVGVRVSVLLVTVTVDVQDAEEQQQLHQLMQELIPVADWVDRVGKGTLSACAGSPLARDDRRSAPFHVSHAAAASLGVAVDHVHCLRRSIEGCAECKPSPGDTAAELVLLPAAWGDGERRASGVDAGP